MRSRARPDGQLNVDLHSASEVDAVLRRLDNVLLKAHCIASTSARRFSRLHCHFCHFALALAPSAEPHEEKQPALHRASNSLASRQSGSNHGTPHQSRGYQTRPASIARAARRVRARSTSLFSSTTGEPAPSRRVDRARKGNDRTAWSLNNSLLRSRWEQSSTVKQLKNALKSGLINSEVRPENAGEKRASFSASRARTLRRNLPLNLLELLKQREVKRFLDCVFLCV